MILIVVVMCRGGRGGDLFAVATIGGRGGDVVSCVCSTIIYLPTYLFRPIKLTTD